MVWSRLSTFPRQAVGGYASCTVLAGHCPGGFCLVLVHDHIQPPVQPILHAPALADDLVERLGRQRRAEQEIRGFGGGFVRGFPHPFHLADGRQPRPSMLLRSQSSTSSWPATPRKCYPWFNLFQMPLPCQACNYLLAFTTSCAFSAPFSGAAGTSTSSEALMPSFLRSSASTRAKVSLFSFR